MNLFLRIAIFLPVLVLIAIVVVGQHHTTADATMKHVLRRWLRWLWWTFLLLAGMLGLSWVFIGF